jgi:hypothetical protein
VSDIESRLAVVEDRLGTLLELVNSGPSVRWEDCIRGRLHAVLQAQANEQALAEAIREVRRSQRRRWSSGQKVLAGACGVAVAAAPYVAIALHAG